MNKAHHAVSTLTDRYQTTIPEPIRDALHLSKRDKIEYLIEKDGKVVLTRAEQDDPVLTDFLSFITRDLKSHPEHIQSFSASLVGRAKTLTKDMDVDLDATLSEKDD